MMMDSGATLQEFGPVYAFKGMARSGRALLVCEHASNRVPLCFNGLGLSSEVLYSHAAWDPGARGLAVALARGLDAPLVTGEVSRLVFDCNRTPDQPGAMPERSEIYDIPGNVALSNAARAERIKQIYEPFHAAVAEALAERPQTQAILTVHTFTPVYHGERRKVEIGFLHGADTRLARAMLQAWEGPYSAELNAPYGPADGVSHMVDRHGTANGLPNVMIEVRNDLATDPAHCERIADLLCKAFEAGMAQL